jgi:hypothetical protein
LRQYRFGILDLLLQLFLIKAVTRPPGTGLYHYGGDKNQHRAQ